MHFQLDRLAKEIKDDLEKIIVAIDHPIPSEKLKAREDLSKIAANLPVKLKKISASQRQRTPSKFS